MKNTEYKIPAALLDDVLDLLRALDEQQGAAIFKPLDAVEKIEQLIRDQDETLTSP